MTIRFLLDTNVVSQPILRRPNSKVLGRLLEHGSHSAIAAPVWHELTYGYERLA